MAGDIDMEHMASRLSDILDEGDVDTSDLLERMSAGLSRFVDDDDASRRSGSVASDGSYADDDSDYSDYDSDVDMPRDYRAGLPTPVEVWRSKQPPEHKAVPTRRMGREEVEEMVVRLNERKRDKTMERMSSQHRQLAEELLSLDFRPKISARSRELTAHIEPLPDRISHLAFYKEERLKKERERVEAAEMKHVTKQPDLKTPCVCGRGPGLSSGIGDDELKKHTVFCQKFMKSCAALNKRNPHQKMADRMRRSVHDLSRYGDEKRARIEERRQLLLAEEDRELTFHPRLSARSLKLGERVRREGRDTRFKADLKHKDETFHPKINFRSAAMKRSGDTWKRLHSSSLQNKRERVKREEEAREKEKEELARRTTVVEYQPKYAFVLKHFGMASE
eukprot:PLAT6524.1.p1 GENE.PLAT6524.1~~PLAT6524.1.p1  ORF type:complete len:402 (+),score=155.38 PLAT6524.1:30-1208(+)